MPEPNKKQPKGAPELPDDAKKVLEDQGDISKQKHSEPENLPEVMEPGIAEQEARLGDEELEDVSADQPEADGKKHRVRAFFAGYWRHKKWMLPLTLLVTLGVLLAVPATRYPMLSTFMSSTYKVEIVDSTTGTPVSGATISLDGKSAVTNEKGRAEIKSHVGKRELTVSKKYYADASSQILVGLKTQKSPAQVKLVATGRQVPLKVIDKLSGKPVKNAGVQVLDATARTDETGQAIIVLPATHTTEKAIVTAAGYNRATATIHITNRVTMANTVSLVPAGRVYFLSNKSGTIDVVSTNYDGSGRATVVGGTGNEDTSTHLFVSPSRKYLALLAKRDDSRTPKLYVVDTGSKSLTQMEGVAASFMPVGWADDRFIYTASSLTLSAWQPKQALLRSFDAASGRASTLAETDATGKQWAYARQSFGFVKILDGRVVYGLAWERGGDYYGLNYADASLEKKKNLIASVKPDGSDKRTLKSLSLTRNETYSYLYAIQPKPQTLYIRHDTSAASVFYAYQDDAVTQTNAVNEDSFYKQRPTYFVSPNGQRTFWTETRDGKGVVFVGDADGDEGTQVATLDNSSAYGWNTDRYLLVSKSGSQLYVLPVEGLAKGRQPLKISDYYTPNMRGF